MNDGNTQHPQHSAFQTGGPGPPAPSQYQRSARGASDGVQSILEAAERHANEIRAEAEDQALQYIAEVQRRADQIAATRMRDISNLTDGLVDQASNVRQQSEQMISALELAIRAIGERLDDSDRQATAAHQASVQQAWYELEGSPSATYDSPAPPSMSESGAAINRYAIPPPPEAGPDGGDVDANSPAMAQPSGVEPSPSPPDAVDAPAAPYWRQDDPVPEPPAEEPPVPPTPSQEFGLKVGQSGDSSIPPAPAPRLEDFLPSDSPTPDQDGPRLDPPAPFGGWDTDPASPKPNISPVPDPPRSQPGQGPDQGHPNDSPDAPGGTSDDLNETGSGSADTPRNPRKLLFPSRGRRDSEGQQYSTGKSSPELPPSDGPTAPEDPQPSDSDQRRAGIVSLFGRRKRGRDDQSVTESDRSSDQLDAPSSEVTPDPVERPVQSTVEFSSPPEEALIKATQLAVAGSDRDEIMRVLRRDFGILDPSQILDRIVGGPNSEG